MTTILTDNTPDAEALVNRADPYAKALLSLTFFIATPAMLVIILVQRPVIQIGCTYALLLCLVLLVVFGIKLYTHGTGRMSVPALAIGFVIIIGGTLFDMIITVMKNPSLTSEANPIARIFLDNGYSLLFVYIFAIIGQSIWIVLRCIMWAAFLRHYATFLSSIQESHPRSVAEHTKAAFGYGHLTWRQTMLPYKLSELPRAYHLFWFLVFMMTGEVIMRWYFGLEWLGLSPLPSNSIMAVVLTGTFVSYLLLHWYDYSRMRRLLKGPVIPSPGSDYGNNQ